jgi:hypothetical protein
LGEAAGGIVAKAQAKRGGKLDRPDVGGCNPASVDEQAHGGRERVEREGHVLVVGHDDLAAVALGRRLAAVLNHQHAITLGVYQVHGDVGRTAVLEAQRQLHVGHGPGVRHEHLGQRLRRIRERPHVGWRRANGLGELLVEVLADGNAVAVLDGRAGLVEHGDEVTSGLERGLVTDAQRDDAAGRGQRDDLVG